MSGFFQFNETLERTPEPDDIGGFHVEATDGSIGHVLEFNDEPGQSFIVVDTGGWLLSKKVVLPAGVVERIDRDAKRVHVNRTKDEIKAAPEFDEETYRQSSYHEQLSRHYTGS